MRLRVWRENQYPVMIIHIDKTETTNVLLIIWQNHDEVRKKNVLNHQNLAFLLRFYFEIYVLDNNGTDWHIN